MYIRAFWPIWCMMPPFISMIHKYNMYAYKIKVLSTTYTNNILRIPDNQLMDKPHNKDILMEIRIGGWKITVDWTWFAIMIISCSLTPGEMEDSTRQSTPIEAHNNILLILILGYWNSCGIVCTEYSWSTGEKRLFDVNSKWLGKRGTNNDWDDKKQTFLQCSNSLAERRT